MKSQVYSELFSSKVSSAGIWDEGGNEVGEAVEVMMERRGSVEEEGAADTVVASLLAFL